MTMYVIIQIFIFLYIIVLMQAMAKGAGLSRRSIVVAEVRNVVSCVGVKYFLCLVEIARLD